jgi:hypothetical protein
MAIVLTDQKLRQITVNNILDVTGPNNVPPSSYEIGWRAHVKTATVDNDRYFTVVIDNTTNEHKWLELVTSASASSFRKPDQRFTVGLAAYDLLEPGTASFTTIAAGITEAANPATPGVTLGAASAISRRMVEVEPGEYAENLTLQSFVGLRGMGASPTETVIVPSAGTAVAINANAVDQDFVIENLTIAGAIDINIAATALGGGVIVLRDVVFDNTRAVPASINITSKSLTPPQIVLERCCGTLSAFAAANTGSVSIRITGRHAPAQSPDNGANNGQLLVQAPITLDCAVTNELYIGDNAIVRRSSAGDLISAVPASNGSFIITLDDSYLHCGSNDSLVVCGNTGNGFVSISGVHLDGQLETLVTDNAVSGNVVVNIEKWPFLTTSPMPATSRAFSGITGGSQSNAYSGNALLAKHNYGTFVVPAPGPIWNGFYATNLPNSLNGSPFDFTKDLHTVNPDYGPVLNIDPDSGNSTFRYALFQLPEPEDLEDGRKYTIKNTGDPSSVAPNISGPIAITLPAGGTSRIEHLNSRLAANTIITSQNYFILAPGDSVTLVVDRTTDPTTPQYRVVT